MSDQAAQDVPCEHHWVSIHQPDLPIYYVDQCSQCHKFNAVRMRQEIEKAGYSKFISQSVVGLTRMADGYIEKIGSVRKTVLTTNKHEICPACDFYKDTMEHAQRCMVTYG